MVILVLHRGSKVLLVKKMPDFIPGPWGFPSQIIRNRRSAEENACRLSLRIICSPIPLSQCAKLTHAIGHRQIAAHVFSGETIGPIRSSAEEISWIEHSQAGQLLTSSLFLKALSKLEA
jgi:hypothetical protein